MALFSSIFWMTWPIATALLLGLFVLIQILHQITKYVAQEAVSGGKIAEPERLSVLRTTDKDGANKAESRPVMSAEEHANLDDRERSMIRSILRLDEFNARDIMVPRVDIVSVEVTDDLSDVANLMLESGHSRLPVYRDNIDNIIGVIYSRDLLPLLSTEDPWPSIEEMTRQPFFVPESKRLDELLAEFQRMMVHMALVVDEHGGTEGLVTLEDLLEEIVGEIEDEFSTDSDPPIVTTGDGSLIVDARTSLNDLSNTLNKSFPNANVDTVGGLVYSNLGKMPQVGDHVNYEGLRIEVLSTLGRRLRKLKLLEDPQGNPEP